MAADPAPKLWRRLTSPAPSPVPSPKSHNGGLAPLPTLFKELEACSCLLQRAGSGLSGAADPAGNAGTHSIRAYHGAPPNPPAADAAAGSQHGQTCTHSPAKAPGAVHAAAAVSPLRGVSININSPRVPAPDLAQLQPRRRPPPPLITLPADPSTAGPGSPAAADHSPTAAAGAAAAAQHSPKPRRPPPPPPAGHKAAPPASSSAGVAQPLHQADQHAQVRLPPQQERAHFFTRLA